MTPIVVLDILMEKGLQLIDLDAKESWLGGGHPYLTTKVLWMKLEDCVLYKGDQ